MTDEESAMFLNILKAITARNKKAMELILNGLATDGAHHKQWYLQRLLRLFRPDLESLAEVYDPGIAP